MVKAKSSQIATFFGVSASLVFLSFAIAVVFLLSGLNPSKNTIQLREQPAMNNTQGEGELSTGSMRIEFQPDPVIEIEPETQHVRLSAVGSDSSDRLEAIRAQAYYKGGRDLLKSWIDFETGKEHWELKRGNPDAIPLLTQWFYEDPTAFLKAFVQKSQDVHMELVLRNSLTGDMVHMLSEYLPNGPHILFDIGSDHGLQYQVPQLYLERFRQMSASNNGEFSIPLVRAVADVNYEWVRPYLIRQIKEGDYPTAFFSVLEDYGVDDPASIATDMWYATDSIDTQRAKIAFRYGVPGSPRVIADLLNSSSSFKSILPYHIDPTLSVEQFPSYVDLLWYEPQSQRWMLPEE